MRLTKREFLIGVHLFFRTKRFGVNGMLWCQYDSIFGWGFWKRFWSIIRIRPMIENYKYLKLRAGTMAHFTTDETYERIFKKGKKIIKWSEVKQNMN